MQIELKPVPLPPIACPTPAAPVPAGEYDRRLDALFASADSDWVLVYGDREHFANLAHLVNFDPRFEEALLVLGADRRRVLIVGNEGLGYTGVLPLPVEIALCQSFSLPGQARDPATALARVLAQVGLRAGHSVCAVGWKYLEPFETTAPQRPAYLPAFLVETVRELIGPHARLADGTALLMHPQHGQRARNCAAQIAVFESAARQATCSVFNILRNTRPGMTERQAARRMEYDGAPFSMHPIFTSGSAEINGLRSAGARLLAPGDAISVAVGYWGSLVCRAGLLTDQVQPAFFEQTVQPYFRALVSWYEGLRLGARGDEIFAAVAGALEGSGLRSALNPGHLTSLDEWLHSPIRPDSAEKIQSGMVFQCDIIPTPLRPGELLNCEDTVAVADAALRAEIAAQLPELWARIQQRRAYLQEVLGILLPEEVLPLTDATACLPPFWLAPELCCVVTGR